MLRWLLLFLLPLASVIAQAEAPATKQPEKAQAPPSTESEQGRFEGTWRLVSLTRDGKSTPEADLGVVKSVFHGDRYTYKGKSGDRDEGTFTIDATKKPAVMRTTRVDGVNRGKTLVRIYKFSDKETVSFCSPGPSEVQPRSFEAADGSGRELTVWQREKM